CRAAKRNMDPQRGPARGRKYGRCFARVRVRNQITFGRHNGEKVGCPMLRIWIGLLITVLIGGFAWAQTTDTIVSGTVTDQSGAAMGGVPITARNLATGVVTTTTSNEVGVYVFPPLQPGRYDFSAEQPGFSPTVTAGVTLEAGTRISLNHVLKIGSTT